jgi:hypothetical protein
MQVPELVIVVRTPVRIPATPWQPGPRVGWAAELDLDTYPGPTGYSEKGAWDAIENLMLGLALDGMLERCFSPREALMSVQDLIDVLSQHDPNARVQITWESTVHDLTPDHIYVAKDGRVMLDGDGCFYKDSFMRGAR